MTDVAVLLADGLEEIEAVTVIDILRRAGVNVTAIGITGREIHGSHEIDIRADQILEECGDQLFDALVLPGGEPGTTNLSESPEVISFIKRHRQADRILAAICAAPRIFADLGYLDDRPATGHPTIRDRLDDARFFEDPVVQTENMVTARGAGTAVPFALSIVSLLVGPETATDLADDIAYTPMEDMIRNS